VIFRKIKVAKQIRDICCHLVARKWQPNSLVINLFLFWFKINSSYYISSENFVEIKIDKMTFSIGDEQWLSRGIRTCKLTVSGQELYHYAATIGRPLADH
jgi:hypothetical protein